VRADVVHELALEVGGRAEDAAVDEVTLDLAEPKLDLVEPGGVGGSEVQADVGVKLQELLHSLCLVGREVVQDDVDLLARRLLGDYRSQEGDELLGGMPGSSPPDHLAGLGVERGEWRSSRPG